MKKYLYPQFGYPKGILGSLVGHIMALKNRARNKWVIELLNIQPGERLLEIGFGPGWAIHQITKKAKPDHIAGIDRSALMVNQARRRNRKAVQEGLVALRQGSVAVLPYPEAAFDKVFSVNSMLFWPNPVENLKEVNRVLRPGGSILIVHQPRSGSAEAIRQIGLDMTSKLNSAGFDEVAQQVKPLKPAPAIGVTGVKSGPL